jgi:hypothetical protein
LRSLAFLESYTSSLWDDFKLKGHWGEEQRTLSA